MEITLIDAHGADHGLRIVVDTDRHTVEIAQWCDADFTHEGGEDCSHVCRARVDLARVLSGKHVQRFGCPFRSMSERIRQAACDYLAYYGGTEDHDVTTPCQEFRQDWGRGKRDPSTWATPALATCAACGAESEKV